MLPQSGALAAFLGGCISGRVDMQPSESVPMANSIEPGKWYVVVDCAKCGEAIPFEETPSPEDAPDLQYRTVSDWECPNCGHQGIYAPGLMTPGRANGRGLTGQIAH